MRKSRYRAQNPTDTQFSTTGPFVQQWAFTFQDAVQRRLGPTASVPTGEYDFTTSCLPRFGSNNFGTYIGGLFFDTPTSYHDLPNPTPTPTPSPTPTSTLKDLADPSVHPLMNALSNVIKDGTGNKLIGLDPACAMTGPYQGLSDIDKLSHSIQANDGCLQFITTFTAPGALP